MLSRVPRECGGDEPQWGQSTLVAFVDGEERAVKDAKEGGAVDDQEVVGPSAAPTESDETPYDFSRVDVADFVPIPRR